MTQETMNVHQALCELKTLDSRIAKATSYRFCIANKHANTKIKGQVIDNYIEEAKAAYQQAKDLIKRREAIKKAVVLSNATTKIVVGNEEMTVAEAIEMKNAGIEKWENLLSQLENCFRIASNECASNNENALDDRADRYIQSMFGNTDMKNASAEMQKVRADFIAAQTYELVDPLGISEEIRKWNDKIDKFSVNVDSALSTSNALTQITIEY